MVFDLPDVNFVTNRLLQNPKDFGNVFRVYYGDRADSRLRDLIRKHLIIAAQLVNAAKAGDNAAAAEIEKKWYANGDEIATFVGSINPYWSAEDWKRMYRTHLGLVKSEAVNLLTKNYSAETSTYDELESQALEIADIMIHGIVKQFPQKFK
ncbi:acetylglutamate kinase [Clostridium sp. YIM B02515]|uniref:Acetylglutamate kinase n=1 Tax=Clostridium rhizosphaerae TaxID=2803861 RepID=A0ABS1T5L9_9CLOT|nr:acetylglutamate kinase [Clostridium rhizosphaerae]MBL4934556.1 acetylglutamate kinase [Clostridium rhizosphaerae]